MPDFVGVGFGLAWGMRYLVGLSGVCGLILVSGCQIGGRGAAVDGVGAMPSMPPGLSFSRSGLERLPTGERADLVIYFASWENIGILEPKVAQGPFLYYMNLVETEQMLPRLPGKKRTAVVIADFYYTDRDRAEQQAKWISVLRPLGYERVVFVKKQPEETLAQARVLRDEQLR
jgi:hypothetical protein